MKRSSLCCTPAGLCVPQRHFYGRRVFRLSDISILEAALHPQSEAPSWRVMLEFLAEVLDARH